MRMTKTHDRLRVKLLGGEVGAQSGDPTHFADHLEILWPGDRDDRKRWCSCSKMPRVRCVVPCLSHTYSAAIYL